MESLGGSGLGLSTLLGPEGSLTAVGGFSVRTDAGGPPGGVCRVGCRPCVENFTVDASIFVVCNKLLRAIGGCLGTKSR